MKNRLIPFLLFLLTSFTVPAEQAQDVRLQLALRTRVQMEGGNWKETIRLAELDPRATAIIICDMWDKHWCKSATERCDQLAKDLTDSMYNPRKSPYVSHDQGTALVVEHIEKYWCPTTRSEELRFAPAGIHF